MEKVSTTINLSTALDIFEENISDIKSTLLLLMQQRIEKVKREHGTFVPRNDFEKEIWGDCVKHSITYAIEVPKRTLKRIIARQQQALTPNNGYITDEHIERAKEYPLHELYDGKLQKIQTGYYKGLCPLSPEKTASFFIKNNKYKCFGCDAYGDSISFYMKMNNVGFIKAVRSLSTGTL